MGRYEAPFGWPDPDTGEVVGVVADNVAGDALDWTVARGFRVPLAGLVTRNRDRCAPPPVNQKRGNSCVAAAGGYLLSRLEFLRTGFWTPRSTLFGWFEARPPEDRSLNVGCQIRDFIDVARRVGIPSADAWPYETVPGDYLVRLEQRPPPEAYEEASRWQALKGYRIPDGDAEGIAAALASGHVVVTALRTFESFYEGTGADGIVPKSSGERVGLHAEAWWDVDSVGGVPGFWVLGTYGPFGKAGWYFRRADTFAADTRDTWAVTEQELPR